MSSAERLTSALRTALPGAVVCWLALIAIEAVFYGGGTPAYGWLLVSGVLAAYVLLGLLLYASGAAVSAAIRGPLERASRMDWTRSGLIAFGVAAAAYFPLRMLGPTLMPGKYAFLDLFYHLIGVYGATCLGAVVSLLVFGRGARGRRYPRTLWGVMLIVALGLTIPDYRVVSNGREWMLLLGSILVLLFSLGTLDGGARFSRAGATGFALMLLSLCMVPFTLGDAHARAAVVRFHPGVAPLLGALQMPLDMDGDGFRALLGGHDCDDFDPGIHPFALEFVGNGIDENCSGGALHGVESPPPPRLDPGAPRHNILLVSVDALRADVAYDGRAMPRLASFAKRAAVFEQAYVQATHTGHSLQSIVTGHYPMTFIGPGGDWLGSPPTMAEYLKTAGYRTLVQHQVWMDTPAGEENFDRRQWSVYAGFDELDDSLATQNAGLLGVTSDQTTDRFLGHLAALMGDAQPFFAWVHYFDPHAEYLPRDGTPFAGDTRRQRYMQEVFATDRAIGRLLDELERREFFDDGMLVIFADHGEFIGEHGRYGHAHWVDEPVLRAPLVIAGPGVRAGRHGTRVRMVDIFPTVLEGAAGIAATSDGENLQPIWEGTQRADREVFVQNTYRGGNARAILSGDLKYVLRAAQAAEYLFDLATDPGETRNLIDERPGDATRLRARMGTRWDLAMNSAIIHRRVNDEARRACAEGNAEACAQLEPSAR